MCRSYMRRGAALSRWWEERVPGCGVDVGPHWAAGLSRLQSNWVRGAGLHPVFARGTKAHGPRSFVRGRQSHCHLFKAISGTEQQKEKGWKKKINTSKRPPYQPAGIRDGVTKRDAGSAPGVNLTPAELGGCKPDEPITHRVIMLIASPVLGYGGEN